MSSEIVISGMSGRFPESDSVAEFGDNLYNKVDLVTEDNRRWEPGLYGLPRRMGMLKDISKFDNTFFGVPEKQSHSLDPQARILLEVTYESIVDSGYDPGELRGRNIGVFIGNCTSESLDYFTLDLQKSDAYAGTGCNRSMLANRLSYAFDFKGPSFVVDAACSSSALALYEAVMAMRRGDCEAAIVGGANLCLKPGNALQFFTLNMLSDDGMCKSFDATCNGYARSEAVCTLFLQKDDVARRKYASIVNIRTNTDGFKEEGITVPSAAMQSRLMAEVYEECKLDPLKVSYVEAHCAGTPVDGPIEMSAIADVFCKGRKEQLLVGSVKSNMGHSEATAGICSIVKILIGMEKCLIPPNIHFNSPNPEIKALMEGQVKIVASPTPWDGEYAAFNSFGMGGVNVHGVLQSHPVIPQLKEVTDEVIPQLVLFSGRTEESVQTFFDCLDENETSKEFFALLHKSAYISPHLKPFRGYKLLTGTKTMADTKQIPNDTRPLWYVFSGMGSQWPGMAKQLMQLKVFANSIQKAAKILETYGLNLIELVTDGARGTSNAGRIIPDFVSIAAVQVALVDVLNELGLKPDGIVGHSLGEIGCAYADGCLTAQQMILAAYWLGRSLEEANMQEGAMAVLGITWSQANERCPKDIYPACHNARDSVTVAGPKNSVSNFVEALKAENVFTSEVNSCGCACHSPYIFAAADALQKYLKNVIPNAKPISNRWVSSSHSEDKRNSPESKIFDAMYIVNNLVSPVLFHEALQHIPGNAIVLEISPHQLLQTILKKDIGPQVKYIGLMKRNVDNTIHFLSSIGRLYTAGFNPDIDKLYPAVQFPVPKGTPMISPLIKWNHSETWSVAKWDTGNEQSQMIIEVNPGPPESSDHYLLGHCIDTRNLYPATGYIVLAWRALAKIKNREITTLPVIFVGVKLHRVAVLSETTTTKFIVDITSSGGDFEISENGRILCTGRVYTPESIDPSSCVELNKKNLALNRNDIYKELTLRGYDYGPTFQGIISSDLERNQGLLEWSGDWVVFLDNILQFSLLGTSKRALYLPTRIQKLTIDPIAHNIIAKESLNKYKGVPVSHNKLTNQCFAGGVQIKNLKASLTPRQPSKQYPVLEKYQFVPYNEYCILSETDKELYDCYIRVCSSVSKNILEVSGKTQDQITDIMNTFKEADDATVANCLKLYSQNNALLKSLCAIQERVTSTNFTMHVKNYATSYLSDREYDILSQTMLSEVPLRTVIDVVLENAKSRTVKIAEVAEASTLLSSKINECIQTLGVLNVYNYISHYNSEVLDKEYIPSNAETVSWDYNSTFDFKDVDLFVLKYLSSSIKELKQILKNSLAALKNDGFIAILQRTHHVPAELFLSKVGETCIPILNENDLEQTFKELNLIIISKKSDALSSTLYLLRKTSEITFKESVIHISVDKYEKWVDQLKEKMLEIHYSSEAERVWLISEDSNHSGIVGLVNCLRQEPGGSSIRCVFTGKTNLEVPEFNLNSSFYKDLLQKNLVMNVLKMESWGSYRHILCKSDCRVETEHAYLDVLTRGDLSSLVWIDSPLKYFTPSDKTILCQVYYASLNFKDIMLASGELSPDTLLGELAVQDCILGYEFSGRSMNGQRVMGILSHRGLATTVAADLSLMWDVPDKWTLEEASTVPTAYATAYYALIAKGNLQKGERVLINSGSGDVGQAAIAIALRMGCEIFTSVGTSEKREFLKKRFPQLQDRNFCNSRDASFEHHVLQQTNGEGVDAVLNYFADEKFEASLNCLCANGRFLDIGKYDLPNSTPHEMAAFLKNISYHRICMDTLYGDKYVGMRAKQEVVELVKKGISDDVVVPLNTTIFNYDQAEQAFRYMTSDLYIGKVVIKIKEEEPQKITIPTPVRLPAITRTVCKPRNTYIIIGGLGGFGLELCQWLVERGAKNIVLTSRSGIKSGYQKICIDRWTKLHETNILVSNLNAAKLDEAKKLFELAASHGPIGGIFNLALVLKDAFMENQTVQNYIEVCESKVQSTKNMDELSRELCPDLDWFVCFSSVVCGRGNAGQSNYGYANSVMERICEDRSREDLPGLAIQWGAIGDVGFVQNTVGLDDVADGTVPQRISSCLSVLDTFLQQNNPVVSSFLPYQPSKVSLHKSSKPTVLNAVAKIFGIKDTTSINPEMRLRDLGMDSLMAFELEQCLESEFEIILTTRKMKNLKIKDLVKLEKAEENKDSTEKTTYSEVTELAKFPGNSKGTVNVQKGDIWSKIANWWS